MKKLVGILVVLMCVGLAQGAMLDEMGDSGQFSRDVLATTVAPGSYWSSHVSWANAQVTLANDGGAAPSNYVKMAVQWYPRSANTWYINSTASGATEAWSVSADLSATLTGNQDGGRYMNIGTSTGAGLFDPWAFQMNLKYKTDTIDWIAAGQSGSTSLGAGNMSRAWTNVVISYDAATGAAVGTFGGVEIFNVTGNAGITANTVYFSRSGNYDTGTFNVDNITATSVPEPATMIMIALGGLGLLRKRNA